MHPGVKRKRSSSLDQSIDLEQQQQSLLDLSIMKLQQDQVRSNVEPRLLRFVLINNALRALQGHMLHVSTEEDNGLGCWDYDGTSNMFLMNTLKEGGTFSSLPSPVKMKLDFGEQNSPLVRSSPFHMSVQDDAENLFDDQGLAGSSDKKASNGLTSVNNQWCGGSSLGKRNSVDQAAAGEVRQEGGVAKKPCRPSSLSISSSSGRSGSGGSVSSESSPESDSPTSAPISPIDFAKLDTSMYDVDYETTNLHLLPLSTPFEPSKSLHPPPSCSTGSNGLKVCGMQALSVLTPPHSSDGQLTSTSVTSTTTTSTTTTRTVNGVAMSSNSCEPDLLDDIDQIFNLLMP